MLFTFLAVIAVRPAASLAAPEGEPPAEEPQPPQLVFEPGSYDFGLQPVNNGSSQANFQLRNTGMGEVHVDSVEISPRGDESFWTNSNCSGMTLQPNQTCNVQVSFSPRNATEYAVQLRANAGPYSFTADLTGTGGRAILAPAFNPTDFGVAAVGSPGITHEITVSNLGNMPGGAFIAVISGGAVGSFQLLDENCTGHLLAPMGTCTLQIRFRPLSEGVKTANLGLFGESDGGTQVVLTGVGSAPEKVANPPLASADGPASANVVSDPPAGPRANSHKHRIRIRRRHRRADLHVARRVPGALDRRAR
jgi:hypothetical protein